MPSEENQWVLATWFSSLHKSLEKASGAWELFTEGKVLSLWTPQTPFPWRRGFWQWMNHSSSHCKLQVPKAEVREQRCTPRIEVFIMNWQLRWNYLWRGSESSLRLKAPSHCTSSQLSSNTLELLGCLSHLLAWFSLNELTSVAPLLVLLSWGDGPDTDGTPGGTGSFAHCRKVDTTMMTLLWRISSLTSLTLAVQL